ncbi:ABC transporter substrate-binding protein [Paenibacillus sp. KS1]|uniref:ABC transporter substrate-binding protein n=1 Tax=Paenibacillus sp. KS1 TaxID=1849249 RepID=UPI0009F580CA|nr:ABC transporter substrate-binding protein [Paenibacillus sp. KS1]
MRKIRKIVIISLLISTLLLGCSQNKEVKNDEKLIIGLVFGDTNNEEFQRRFVEPFLILHPNVDIKVVSAITEDPATHNPNGPYQNVVNLLTGTEPVDLLFMDSSLYQMLSQQNQLKELSPFINKDKFDINSAKTSVIDYLKQLGNGNLYGLSPSFQTKAVFYNKMLFQKANLEPPHDLMTWEQLFQKAELLSLQLKVDNIYGISFDRYNDSNYFNIINNYLSSLNVRMYDINQKKMTVATDTWKESFQLIDSLFQKNITPIKSEGEDLFLNNKVGIIIENYNYFNSLKKQMPSNFDIVTYPIHTGSPHVGSEITFSNIIAINANANNTEVAWEYLKFIHSQKWAKSNKDIPSELFTFYNHKEDTVYNIDAFYKLQSSISANYQMDLYNNFKIINDIRMIITEGNKQIESARNKEKSITEALNEWEGSGNELLNRNTN